MALRLFVALEPPDRVRRRIAAIERELRDAAGRSGDRIRWVDPDNIHLTLQFLGAVAEERLEDVRRAVAGAASASSVLHLEVAGAGAFPSPRRARVLWAGLQGDLEPLGRLAAEVGRRLAPLGFPPEERPFSAHVTLGRARDGGGLAGLAGAIARAGGGAPVPWRASAVTLFRSHLSPEGARYEALFRAPLGPPAPA